MFLIVGFAFWLFACHGLSVFRSGANTPALVCVLLIDDDDDEGHCSSMVLASVFACSSIACVLLVPKSQ